MTAAVAKERLLWITRADRIRGIGVTEGFRRVRLWFVPRGFVP